MKKNLDVLDSLSEETRLKLLPKYLERLETIRKVLEQQQMMIRHQNHRVEDRIVSLRQPHVRPIVRGKARTPVEFGQKIAVSVINGYTHKEIEADREQAYRDSCQRNGIEGKYGNCKRRYGLDLIMAVLAGTAETEVGLSILAMNMAHLLRAFFRSFFKWLAHRSVLPMSSVFCLPARL